MQDSLTVATWNINSIRTRLDVLRRLVKLRRPDVLLLQETRCPDASFPAGALKRLGYRHIALHGRNGHHGVAIASKLPLEDVRAEFIGDVDQPRHVSALVRFDGRAVRLHSLYVPSGGDEPDPGINPRFRDKLAFVEGLIGWGPAAAAEPALLTGDFNIAPLPEDVWSHTQLLGVISHTPAETGRLTRAQEAAGWIDVVRRDRPPPERVYTWWSYRNRTWPGSNRGRRLDHVWASPEVADAVESVEILTEARGWDRPSDHVPLIATLKAAG